MDRPTFAFAAFILLACGAFAAAPWQAMHTSAIDGYSDAPSGVALASSAKGGAQLGNDSSSPSVSPSALVGAAGEVIATADK
jgi:hypothetical protein